MTLRSAGTGDISLGGSEANASVNVELGQSATATISLNDTNVRTLLGIPSGTISLYAAYGKTNRIALNYTFSSSQSDVMLTANITGYISGKSDITITVNAGVYLWASRNNTAGLILYGTFCNPSDTITLINNGYIIGAGGSGGFYQYPTPTGIIQASSGGPALALPGMYGIAFTLKNYGYIAGGGGGGGYSGAAISGGGGAGGGSAGNYPDTYTPILGGGIGSAGIDGPVAIYCSCASGCAPGADSGHGGSGGRILPGVGGAGGNRGNGVNGKGGGAGGGGGASAGGHLLVASGPGGNGGSAGNAGGDAGSYAGAGGGGWGAAGGNGTVLGNSGGASIMTYGQAVVPGPGGVLGTLYGAIV